VRKRVGAGTTRKKITPSRRVGGVVTSQRKRFSSIREQRAAPDPQVVAQQQELQKTRDLIKTRKAQLETRKAGLIANLRQGNLGMGGVERANNEVDVINAQLKAISEVEQSIQQGKFVKSADANEFIDERASARVELRIQSERVRKAAEAKEPVLTTRTEERPQKVIGEQEIAAARTTFPKFLTPKEAVKLETERQENIEKITVAGKTPRTSTSQDFLGDLSPVDLTVSEPSVIEPFVLDTSKRRGLRFFDVPKVDLDFPGFEGGTKKFTITDPEFTPIEFRNIKPGEITFGEAQRLGFPVGNLQETRGERLKAEAKVAGTVLGLTAASATSPFVAGAIGTTVAARGLGFIGEAISPTPGGTIASLKIKEGETEEDFQKRVLTQRVITGGKGALLTIFGVAGIGGAVSAAQTAVDIQALRDLQAQKFKVIGVEKVRTPSGSLFKIKAFREAGAAKQVVDFNLPVFKTGTKTFSITGGTGTSKTALFSFRQETLLTGEQSFTLGARGSFKNFLDFDDIQQAFGSGTLVETSPGSFRIDVKTKDVNFGFLKTDLKKIRDVKVRKIPKVSAREFQEFKFGGLTERRDGFFRIVSGTPEKLRLGDEITALVKPSAIGVIKEFKSPTGDVINLGKIGTGSTKLRGLSAPGLVATTEQQAATTVIGGATAKIGSGEVSKLLTPLKTQQAATTVIGGATAKIGSGEVSKLLTPLKTQQAISTTVSTVPALSLISQQRSATIQTPALKIRQETTQAADTKLRTLTQTIQTPRLSQRGLQSLKTAQLQRSDLLQETATTTNIIVPDITPRLEITETPIRIRKITEKIPPFLFLKGKPKEKPETFITQVKRFGQFKTIGRTRTGQQAFKIGAERVGKTLAATFRIKGGKQKVFIPGIPRSIRRKKGKRLTFIEKKEFRLDTLGEIKEIKLAKLKKGKLKL